MEFVLDQKVCTINFDEKNSIILDLIPSSVTNKFFIITDLLKNYQPILEKILINGSRNF